MPAADPAWTVELKITGSLRTVQDPITDTGIAFGYEQDSNEKRSSGTCKKIQ